MERVRSACMGLRGGPATARGRGRGASEALPAMKEDASNATRHAIVNAAATKRRRCTGVRRLGVRKYTSRAVIMGDSFRSLARVVRLFRAGGLPTAFAARRPAIFIDP